MYWLEDAFSRRVAVFVSSDPRDNPGGERWLDRLEPEWGSAIDLQVRANSTVGILYN
jgi:hypothetical protein